METINCRVLMLPADQLSGITLTHNILSYKTNVEPQDVCQHLYFISNDPIKEGDWVYNSEAWCGSPYSIIKVYSIHNNAGTPFYGHSPYDTGSSVGQSLHTANQRACKKIIASTDPTLFLPLIPESFVKEYVKSNGEITDVKLEIEECGALMGGAVKAGRWVKHPDFKYKHTRLKLTANNEVVVDKRVNCVTPTVFFGGSPQASSGIEPQYQSEYKHVFNKKFKEDVAKAYWKSLHTIDGTFTREISRMTSSAMDDFKAGWEAREEQSANDTIEFIMWKDKYYNEQGSHYENNILIKTYVHKSKGGVPIRIKQLHELWLITMKQL